MAHGVSTTQHPTPAPPPQHQAAGEKASLRVCLWKAWGAQHGVLSQGLQIPPGTLKDIIVSSQ